MSGLALLVVLLVLNALFVAAEFALLSAQRARIELLARDGDRRAAAVLADLRQLTVMLASTQLGITACSVGLGYVGEPAVAHLLEDALSSVVEVPENVLHVLGFAVALSLVTLLHMVLGEMVPKNLALAAPERTALLLGPPLGWFVRAFGPVVRGLNSWANLSLRAVGIQPQEETKSVYSSTELRGVIAESVREGALDRADEERLTSALDLEATTAADLMLPMDALVTLPHDATVGDLERAVATHRYSRYPIVNGGHLVGFAHVKDLLNRPPGDGEQLLPPDWVRPLVPVPPDLPVDDLLTTMQAGRTHLAMVIDLDAHSLGVVPLEHVLEAFVGEIAGILPPAERWRGESSRRS